MTEWVLALDVGGTKLAAALMDRSGRLVHRQERPTLAGQGGGAAVLGRLLQLGTDVLRQSGFEPLGGGWRKGDSSILAIGLGTGGQVDPATGVIAFANENIPGWTGIPVRQALQDAFGLPAIAANDANCAALAEASMGAGLGHAIVLCVTVGTGIGGGLVHDGRVYRGARGGAMEVGHILIDHGGLPCVCGNRGCLEMYASGPSILAEFERRHGETGIKEILGIAPAQATTRHIVALAREGVSEALELVVRAGSFLGIGLASMSHVLDPSMIVIGGGMADAWDLLAPPMKAAYEQRSIPLARSIPICKAQLGADAVLVGAGQLAWQCAEGSRGREL